MISWIIATIVAVIAFSPFYVASTLAEQKAGQHARPRPYRHLKSTGFSIIGWFVAYVLFVWLSPLKWSELQPWAILMPFAAGIVTPVLAHIIDFVFSGKWRKKRA